MKLLLVDDSVRLSKRDGIIIVVVFVFVWFTGYANARVAQSRRKQTS